jgi:hypothetical protein
MHPDLLMLGKVKLLDRLLKGRENYLDLLLKLMEKATILEHLLVFGTELMSDLR